MLAYFSPAACGFFSYFLPLHTWPKASWSVPKTGRIHEHIYVEHMNIYTLYVAAAFVQLTPTASGQHFVACQNGKMFAHRTWNYNENQTMLPFSHLSQFVKCNQLRYRRVLKCIYIVVSIYIIVYINIVHIHIYMCMRLNIETRCKSFFVCWKTFMAAQGRCNVDILWKHWLNFIRIRV